MATYGRLVVGSVNGGDSGRVMIFSFSHSSSSLICNIRIPRYKEKEWDIEQLVGSGGMPSSYSATVTALGTTVGVGFQDGISGTKFAIAIILAFIVMYDANGVCNKHVLLNQIVYALPIEHPLPDNRPLRELLGHNPPQVATGALLGFLTTTVVHLISQVATMA
ncbi:uncharacterized protein LOC111883760 [Lactuca sativa]|uniref:uncharacterized protein LOC111883760 n=1 Tax=Lactuca sativa TaxID=4236 RepID=UPI0022AFC218|nr:uncharacterized protein LOC111883760 [Lactuca sativa]